MSDWIDDMMNAPWYLIEKREKRIGRGGVPEVYYACYIATDPGHVRDHNVGYKLAEMQRWFGPAGYNGFLEKRIGQHLVEAHNAMLREQAGIPPPQLLPDNVQVVPDHPEPKKKGNKKGFTMTEAQKAALAAGRKKRIDRMKEEQHEEAVITVEEPGSESLNAGAIQAETSQVSQKVQPQTEAPKLSQHEPGPPSHISSSSGLYR